LLTVWVVKFWPPKETLTLSVVAPLRLCNWPVAQSKVTV
jgi:hypothetical protein